MIVKTVKLVDLMEMRKRQTALTRQVLSRTYLAQHEVESEFTIIIIKQDYTPFRRVSEKMELCR